MTDVTTALDDLLAAVESIITTYSELQVIARHRPDAMSENPAVVVAPGAIDRLRAARDALLAERRLHLDAGQAKDRGSMSEDTDPKSYSRGYTCRLCGCPLYNGYPFTVCDDCWPTGR